MENSISIQPELLQKIPQNHFEIKDHILTENKSSGKKYELVFEVNLNQGATAEEIMKMNNIFANFKNIDLPLAE